MYLSYEETAFSDIHVRDMMDTDRTEAKRRLDFITAKLANAALDGINLHDEINSLRQLTREG